MSRAANLHRAIFFCLRMVLRNFLAQRAIDQAEREDFSEVRQLLEELKTPYEGSDRQTKHLPKPDETSTGAEALPATTDTTQKRSSPFDSIRFRSRENFVCRCDGRVSSTDDLRIASTVKRSAHSCYLIFVNVDARSSTCFNVTNADLLIHQ